MRWKIIVVVMLAVIFNGMGARAEADGRERHGKATTSASGKVCEYEWTMYSPPEMIAPNVKVPEKIASSKDALMAMYAYMYAGDVQNWRKLWNNAPNAPKFEVADETLQKGWKAWLQEPHYLLYQISYLNQDIFVTEQKDSKRRAKFFFKKQDGRYCLNRDLAADDFAQFVDSPSFDPKTGKH